MGGGQCEAAIAEECVARTCPKFCQSIDKTRRESCITQCSPEQSCKAWQPGMLNESSSVHEVSHKAASIVEPVHHQTWAQFLACVAQKRHTSGYDGGDWRVITSPSYRVALVHLVVARMSPRRANLRSDQTWMTRETPSLPVGALKWLSPRDSRGVGAAADGVYLAITTDESAIANVDVMVASAHNAWLQYRNNEASGSNSRETVE